MACCFSTTTIAASKALFTNIAFRKPELSCLLDYGPDSFEQCSLSKFISDSVVFLISIFSLKIKLRSLAFRHLYLYNLLKILDISFIWFCRWKLIADFSNDFETVRFWESRQRKLELCCFEIRDWIEQKRVEKWGKA